ncbi:hypothetical protein V8G54_034771 [Vigna mungo]|uniref:Uncharacterized protein n=1 Tax=Vigna mungo TaxID=3915 RepID=A0AAQ3MDP8_VIGMU
MGQASWALRPDELGFLGQCGNWACGPIWKLGFGGQYENWALGPGELGLWANMEIGLVGQYGNCALEASKLGLGASVETGLCGPGKLGFGPVETRLEGPVWKLGLGASVENGLRGQCRNWAWWASVENWALWARQAGLWGQCGNWALLARQARLWGQVKLGLGAGMILKRMRAGWSGLEGWDRHVGTTNPKGDVICLGFESMKIRMKISNGIRKAAPVLGLWIDEFQGEDAWDHPTSVREDNFGQVNLPQCEGFYY